MKRIFSVLLSLAVTFSLCTSFSREAFAAAKKYVRSVSVKTSAKLEKGSSKLLSVKVKANARLSAQALAVTVKSSDKSVVFASIKKKPAKKGKEGVSAIKLTARKAGSAVITVSSKTKGKSGKRLSKKINVTVKETENEPFDFKRDVSVTSSVKETYIEFAINSGEISEEELIAQGYTVSGGKASKTVECETAEYTFKKLPSTLDELKKFRLSTRFDPVAALICAFAACETDTLTAVNMYSHSFFEMTDYLNGSAFDVSNADKSGIFYSLKAMLTEQKGKYAYFDGAKPSNAYEPSMPYSFTLVESPYYIKGKDGKPDRYMILISFGGADEQRYVDVYRSGDGAYYCWEDSWKHLAAGIKEPSEKY